jgi:hypothetical protein
MNAARFPAFVLAFALSCGFAMPATVHAALKSQLADYNAAMACQLSLPTIDTKVAPRATGFRNDGTSGTFVICGLSLPSDDAFVNTGTVYVHSFDGVSRTFNCTGVGGQPGDIHYAVKAVTVPANASTFLQFAPADFGFGGSSLPGGYSVSITCSLPPHVAITLLEAAYQQDVGG